MFRTKPNVFILPGWGEKISSTSYQSLKRLLKDRYKVTFLSYTCRKSALLTSNILAVKKRIGPHATNDFIIGFSYGALIAYQLAGEMRFKQVIACSISAILERDLDHYPALEVRRAFSESASNDLRKLKYKRPRSKITLLRGSSDGAEITRRVGLLKRTFHIPLKIVPNTGHRLSPVYIQTIVNELNN